MLISASTEFLMGNYNLMASFLKKYCALDMNLFT